MKALFRKIGRSLKGALGKGSQPRANISGKSFGPKDFDSSQRDKKTGAIRLGAGGIKLSESGLEKLRGGGFKGVVRRAAAAAQKAGAAEAKPKAGAVGKTLGGGTKSQAQKDKEEEILSAVKGFSKRKLGGLGFESGGAVKASSKGRGMGAATQGGGAVGGAAKKKGYAMGGMAMKKGYAAGGPAMKKGYAMGGAAMKKGYASGGSVRGK